MVDKTVNWNNSIFYGFYMKKKKILNFPRRQIIKKFKFFQTVTLSNIQISSKPAIQPINVIPHFNLRQ